MDISPLLHALCAVAAQILVGLFTGNWAYGAIAGCTEARKKYRVLLSSDVVLIG